MTVATATMDLFASSFGIKNMDTASKVKCDLNIIIEKQKIRTNFVSISFNTDFLSSFRR